MALGAQPKQVMWLVMPLADSTRDWRAAWHRRRVRRRLWKSLLVQTSTRDPLTIGSIALLMIVVPLAACSGRRGGDPARSVSASLRVDDAETVRTGRRSLPKVTEDIKWAHDLCFCIGGRCSRWWISSTH
jgi:hypothetical protein